MRAAFGGAPLTQPSPPWHGGEGFVRAIAFFSALLLATPALARDPLPPFAFADAQGRTLTLADYRGKVVLLDFWASWCAPCVQEMPVLDKLQRQFADNGLVVLPVSIDRGGLPKVQLFYKLQGITDLPVLLDEERKAVEALGIEGIPTSYLIARDGRVLAGHVGTHDWEADVALLEKALAE